MAKKNLIVSFFQIFLIVVMSFLCLSLISSGEQLNNTLNAKANHHQTEIIKKQDPKTFIIKYKLVSNGDTVYVDRKLDSID